MAEAGAGAEAGGAEAAAAVEVVAAAVEVAAGQGPRQHQGAVRHGTSSFTRSTVALRGRASLGGLDAPNLRLKRGRRLSFLRGTAAAQL